MYRFGKKIMKIVVMFCIILYKLIEFKINYFYEKVLIGK